MAEKIIYWFDMDHTLINNDCDVSWKYFVVQEGLAEKEETERLTEKFYADYCAGALDSTEFMRFQLREFVGRTVEEMALLTQKHFDVIVKDKIYRDAENMIEKLLAQGDDCAILTSTNSVIARPVADYLGIKKLFGAELEVVDGKYTGNIAGQYPVGPGKAVILEKYCQDNHLDPADFAYFGDSINDRFVLEKVGHAHAVNPSDELKKIALEKSWTILNFQ